LAEYGDSVGGVVREENLVGQPEEIQAAITLEERAKRIIQDAMADVQLMKDVRESQALEESGDKGESWSSVKARLGLV
jgi:hypothetical protein